MTLELTISPEAAMSIRDMIQADNEESVVAVFGVVRGTDEHWVLDRVPSLEELTEIGKKALDALPPTITVDYTIGLYKQSRVPREDIYTIGDIKVYVPRHLVDIVGSRKIVLMEGNLAFSPAIDSFHVQRK